MKLIFFIIVAVFQPSISCPMGTFIYDNYTAPITVTEGESVKLECYAGGESNAPIKWHRESLKNSTNQNIILPNGEKSYYGNVLELPSITRHQRGIYVCSVNDRYGSVFRYIEVTVNFVPFITEIVRIDHFESQELELRCNAESDPQAKVRWFKNNEEMKTTKYKIITNREFDDALNSTLIESDYDFDTYVMYKCEIKNQLGTSKKFLEVTNGVNRDTVPSYTSCQQYINRDKDYYL